MQLLKGLSQVIPSTGAIFKCHSTNTVISLAPKNGMQFYRVYVK